MGYTVGSQSGYISPPVHVRSPEEAGQGREQEDGDEEADGGVEREHGADLPEQDNLAGQQQHRRQGGRDGRPEDRVGHLEDRRADLGQARPGLVAEGDRHVEAVVDGRAD